MRGPPFQRRTRAPLAVIATSLIAAACAPETRHAALEFLFDGVPPYGEEELTVESGIDPDWEWKEAYARRLELRRRQESAQADLYTHQPYAENRCARCHTSQRSAEVSSSGFSVVEETNFGDGDLLGGGRLRTSVVELCVDCHDDYRPTHTENAGMWLHGPVVSGWCVLCHQPHASPFPALVHVEPAARLCGQCHSRTDLLAFTPEHRPTDPAHAYPPSRGESEPTDQVVEDCTSCHDPHRGKDRFMLRPEPRPVSVQPPSASSSGASPVPPGGASL